MKWIIGITKSSLAYKLLVLLQGLQRWNIWTLAWIEY
jgi:hypothetical protein